MKYADKIMNTDKFKNILLSAEGLIRQFRSPADERSIAKGIPIEFLGIFYDYSKMVQPLRIRYRGKVNTIQMVIVIIVDLWIIYTEFMPILLLFTKELNGKTRNQRHQLHRQMG